MDKIEWIKNLALDEQSVEDSGFVTNISELSAEDVTYEFLKDLKIGFLEMVSTFNQMKPSPLGQIKVYGISKTVADFMLFRNGIRMIFSYQKPGVITIRLSQLQSDNHLREDTIVAKEGAFQQIRWFHNDLPVQLDYMVRYYIKKFVESSR